MKCVFLSFIFSGICLLLLSFDLIINSPTPLIDISDRDTKKQTFFPENPNCCIATLFGQNDIKKLLVLGYSLHEFNPNPPKMYALSKHNISDENRELIQKYFHIVDIYNMTNAPKFHQILFWELEDCSPVVAVDVNGLFASNVNELCNAAPFSAVAKNGDPFLFDSSLMVLDPLNPPDFDDTINNQQWKNYINKLYPNWKPLKSNLCVNDKQESFLEFWMSFGSPVYIHYSDKTFKAIENRNADNIYGSVNVFSFIAPKIVYILKKLFPQDAVNKTS